MISQNDRPITICHISDFHLPLTQTVPFLRFAGKRVLGFANLAFNRGNTHKRHPFTELFDSLKKEKPDLTIITGDMVNLALDFEFIEVAATLRSAGFNRDNLLIVPGNHDRYTPGTAMRHDFEKYFAEFLPDEEPLRYPYPVSRKVGPVAVIGLDTSTWRGPIRAAGKLRPMQLSRMLELLDGPFQSLVPVIAMHHPPFALDGFAFKHWRDGLANGQRLIDALEGRHATILHGHIHRESYRVIGGSEVFGVSSASNDAGSPEKQLAYHRYRFSTDGLVEATAVRHWPGNAPGEEFERVSLKNTADKESP